MPGSGTRARTWFWLCATAVVGGRTPGAAPQDAGEPWKVRPAARAGLSGRGPVLGDRLGRGFCNVVHGQMSLGGRCCPAVPGPGETQVVVLRADQAASVAE